MDYHQLSKEELIKQLEKLRRDYDRLKQHAGDEKYRTLLESVNDVVYEYDHHGVITYISPLVKNVSGFSADDIIGTNIRDFLGMDKKGFSTKIDQLQSEKKIITEYEIQHKEGFSKWIQLSTKAIFCSDKFCGGTGVLTDITEKKNAQLKLLASESLYKSILNSSPDNITMTDVQGNILLWSANGARMFGYPEEYDFKGRSILEFIEPSDRERVLQAINERMKTGKPAPSNRFKALKADGSGFWIEVSWEPIVGETSERERLVFIIRDITYKYDAENQIKKAEDRYRRLVENINEVVYDIDSEGELKYISPTIYKISGFRPEDVVGKKIYQMLDESYEFFLSRLEYLINTGVNTREVKMKNKFGEDRWIRFSTNAVFNDGVFVGASGTLIDITERKLMEIELQRSEALYSSILNVSPDAIILTDMTAMVIYVSPAIFRLYHSTDIHDYIGRNLFDFMLESDRERAMLNTRKRLQGERIGVMEYTGLRKDGTQFYFDVDSDIIKDEMGRPTNVLYVIRDITARKEAENQLRLSEEKYRLIAEKISDVVWLMDLEGKSVFVSKSIEKFTGYTVNEYLNQTIQSRFTPESAQKAYVTLKSQTELLLSGAALTKDYLVTIELDYVCKNGEIKTGELLISPVFDEHGNLKVIHGVTRDITERKVAEKALIKSEAKYRSIFETVQDAYYEVSMDGITLEVSPSIELISRGVVRRDDLVGKSFVDFYKDPRERELLQQELALKGHVTDYEITFMHGDVVVPVSLTSTLVLNADGAPEKIVGSIRDISERKKSEQQLRDSEALYHSILTASPDDITICDLNGNIELVSPAGVTMFGCKSVDEMLGLNLLEFVGVTNREYALYNIQRMFEGYFERPGRYVGRKKNGEEFPIEVNGEFLRDANGEPVKLIFVVRDITDRKIAEEKLLESERKYKTFFAENKSIMLMIEPETGMIKDANATACEFYGWAKQELCSMNISQINPMPVEDVKRNLKETLVQKRKVHLFKHRKKDGSICDVEVYAGSIAVDGALYVYAIVHDITERKLIEEQLKESEERFRMIFENVFDGISIFEEDDDPSKRKLVDCNAQFAAMAGREKAELLNIGYIYSLTEPLEENSNEHRLFGLTNKTAYQGAFKWLRPDGKENTIQYIARPISWQGKLYSIGIDRDVTETRRREIQLKKLSQVVEQSPVSIVITDVKGAIEYANPEACRTTGYSLDELIGQNPRILQSGETSEEEYKKLWELITNGNDWHGMFHNKRKNGERYWESSTVAPILDHDGRIVNFVAIKEDITERKKEQEELLKFKTIADSTNSGTSIASLSGEILYINPSFASMLGCDVDEALGRNIADFYHRSNFESVGDLFAEIFDTGGLSALEIWIKRKDLSVFPSLLNATVIYNDKNEPAYVSATCIDITEMMKAEELLRKSEADLNFAQIIANLGSWEIDLVNKVTVWAENLYRVFGLEPFADIDLDEYFYSHVHPDDLSLVDLRDDYKVIVDKSVSNQIRFIMPDGSIKWLQGDTITICDGDRVTGLKGTFLDITRSKIVEQALKNSEHNLNYAQLVAKMGSWMIDVVNGKVEWSKNELKLFGLEEDADVDFQQYFKDHIHPDDLNLQAEVEAFVLKNKKPISEEFRFVMPDGSIRWFKGDVLPIVENGEIVSIIGTHIDITDKKIAENILQESESSLNYAQELAKMGSWQLDLKTNKLTGSANYYRMLSLRPFDQSVDLYEYFLSLVHPDDLNIVKYIQEEAFTSPETKIFEFRLQVGNDLVWIQNFIQPVFKDGHLESLRGVNIDVTEMKQKESQISRLSMAVSQSPVAVVVTDVEGNIEYVNPAFEQITGFPTDFILGKNTRILKSGRNDEKVYRDLWKTIKSGKVWGHEWINIRYNGEFYWESISISPVFNSMGKIMNYLAIKQDITERKSFEERILDLNANLELKIKDRTQELATTNASLVDEIQERLRFEKALRDSERKYRSVVENIYEIVFQTDEDGNWVFLNKSWEAVTGFTVDESIGKLFLDYVHPDDREKNLTMFTPLINQEKDFCRHEIRYLTRDGGFRWIEVFARLGVDEENKPIGTYGTLRDITESKQAEELLQWNKSLLEMMSNSSPLGFLVVDNRSDEILYFNKRFCEIWGIEHLEDQMKAGRLKNRELIPYCLPVLMDPVGFAHSGKPLRDIDNKAIVSDEIAFVGDRTIHRYSTQIRGLDDRYYGRFYIFEDVTDAKRSENELIKARNEADEANQAKSEFLSRMSHELRTPLNSILGFAQLLEMGELSGNQKKGVGHIMRSGKHLLSLINDVLDISRIESGRIAISIEPVQLTPVFDEMIDILKPIAAGKNINMELESSECGSCFVKADKQSLKQVLLNLMNNAIKYNKPDGSIHIRLELIKNDVEAVEQIRISLIDTGIGIASEDIAKIFTPFERIGADKSGIEGTGLGLAVVKKLVEAMGGKLGVESELGKGSTFWIQFERAESQLQKFEIQDVINGSAEGRHTRKSTVLYIEDNASNVDLVAQILQSQRPDIRLVCNMSGKETVNLAIQYKPDLILLDLNLPDIHGSDIIKQLLKNPMTWSIPVVVVSADAMGKLIDSVMEAGAKKYLSKPLDIKDFLETVDEFTAK